MSARCSCIQRISVFCLVSIVHYYSQPHQSIGEKNEKGCKIIMSDSTSDENDYELRIQTATTTTKVASSTDRLTMRSSARSKGKRVNYNYYEDDDDDEENNDEDSVGDDDDGAVDDDDDEVIVLDDDSDDDDCNYGNNMKKKKKKLLIKGEKKKEISTWDKLGTVMGPSSPLLHGRETMHDDSEEEDDDDDHDKKYGRKLAAVPATIDSNKISSISRHDVISLQNKKRTEVGRHDDDDQAFSDEGIDIIIPHSLLDKSRGSGKNECMVLVQVANEPSSSSTSAKSSQNRPLDFHGQSGAIGRFEADGDGGT